MNDSYKTTIALDYDNTYTVDPRFWDKFILQATLHNIRVVIVTYRDEEFDVTDDLVGLALVTTVYYTRGIAKKFFMEHFGEKIDIWIDDRPETILNNSTATPAALKEWRKNGGA